MMTVRFKASKTDLLQKGITLLIIQGVFCPVPSVGHAGLPVSAGQLLVPVPGLTRQWIVPAVQSALVKAGIQPQLYAGHSF